VADLSSILGVPPAGLAYVMVKCGIEVKSARAPEKRKNELYLQCVFENIDDLVPTGLPDPDKYNGDDEE